MVLSPDGRDAFVADKLSCDVRQIDTTTFGVLRTVDWPSAEGCPFGLAAGPGRQRRLHGDGPATPLVRRGPGRPRRSVRWTSPPPRPVVSGVVGKDPVTVTLSPDADDGLRRRRRPPRHRPRRSLGRIDEHRPSDSRTHVRSDPSTTETLPCHDAQDAQAGATAWGMQSSSYSAMTMGAAFSPQAGHCGSRRTLNVRNDSSSES